VSKHGPTIEQEAREYAMALAAALGKYSDEQWQIGPWFMSIVLLARKLADQLVAGELDDRLLDILKHHMQDPDPRNLNNEVAYKWTPLSSDPTPTPAAP
jgi:hypothetical protein